MREHKFESVSIEPAQRSEAIAISSLIESLSGSFFTSPEREGAEPFLASISASAIESYLSNERYIYFVAHSHRVVVGVAALRDNTHLFQLFVAEAFQKRGVGRKIWNVLKQKVSESGSGGPFTVNASLNAVPVYEAFGFIADGGVVSTHGVSFQPMRCGTPAA